MDFFTGCNDLMMSYPIDNFLQLESIQTFAS
jgi:hypothetical protein